MNQDPFEEKIDPAQLLDDAAKQESARKQQRQETLASAAKAQKKTSPAKLAVCAAVVLAICGGTGWFLWHNNPHSEEEPSTKQENTLSAEENAVLYLKNNALWYAGANAKKPIQISAPYFDSSITQPLKESSNDDALGLFFMQNTFRLQEWICVLPDGSGIFYPLAIDSKHMTLMYRSLLHPEAPPITIAEDIVTYMPLPNSQGIVYKQKVKVGNTSLSDYALYLWDFQNSILISDKYPAYFDVSTDSSRLLWCEGYLGEHFHITDISNLQAPKELADLNNVTSLLNASDDFSELTYLQTDDTYSEHTLITAKLQEDMTFSFDTHGSFPYEIMWHIADADDSHISFVVHDNECRTWYDYIEDDFLEHDKQVTFNSPDFQEERTREKIREDLKRYAMSYSDQLWEYDAESGEDLHTLVDYSQISSRRNEWCLLTETQGLPKIKLSELINALEEEGLLTEYDDEFTMTFSSIAGMLQSAMVKYTYVNNQTEKKIAFDHLGFSSISFDNANQYLVANTNIFSLLGSVYDPQDENEMREKIEIAKKKLRVLNKLYDIPIDKEMELLDSVNPADSNSLFSGYSAVISLGEQQETIQFQGNFIGCADGHVYSMQYHEDDDECTLFCDNEPIDEHIYSAEAGRNGKLYVWKEENGKTVMYSCNADKTLTKVFDDVDNILENAEWTKFYYTDASGQLHYYDDTDGNEIILDTDVDFVFDLARERKLQTDIGGLEGSFEQATSDANHDGIRMLHPQPIELYMPEEE